MLFSYALKHCNRLWRFPSTVAPRYKHCLPNIAQSSKQCLLFFAPDCRMHVLKILPNCKRRLLTNAPHYVRCILTIEPYYRRCVLVRNFTAVFRGHILAISTEFRQYILNVLPDLALWLMYWFIG